MAIAGLDIGSSGCKCTIFDQAGHITAYAHDTYDTHIDHRGYMELNPEDVWQAVQHVLSHAARKHKGLPIEALCITSFGEAGVLMDQEGQVLCPSMLYSDPRGAAQCERWIDRMGRWEIMRRSGHNPSPVYSALKLMWLRDHRPEIFCRADKFLQYSGYVLYRLSGEVKEDYSLCARTMVFNVQDKVFDDLLLEGAGLDRSLFPEPVLPGTVAGNITHSMADKLGLPQGLQLILGGQDQVTAAVGGGALMPGMAVNGMGSVDCITPIFDHPNINESMMNSHYGCIPYVLEDHYVTYAFGFAGGSLVRWYRDQMGRGSYQEMEALAPSSPTGLLVLPHWTGAATPYMDTRSQGAIIGLTMDTDNSTVYRGVMEGITMESRINVDRLAEAGIDIQRMTVCGGGSRSRMWTQIKADVLGIPIDVLEMEEAGTLGAALLAGCACGWFHDLQEGVSRWVRIRETIEPHRQHHEQYNAIYQRYRRLYDALKEVKGR